MEVKNISIISQNGDEILKIAEGKIMMHDENQILKRNLIYIDAMCNTTLSSLNQLNEELSVLDRENINPEHEELINTIDIKIDKIVQAARNLKGMEEELEIGSYEWIEKHGWD